MEDTERDCKTGGVCIREDDPGELVAVMHVLDAGLFEADTGEIRDRLAAGDCLAAEASGRVVGASALDGNYIEAAAASPSRRGQGVGTQLVRATFGCRDRFVVDLDGGTKPFYESLGPDIEDRSDGEGRLRGALRDE